MVITVTVIDIHLENDVHENGSNGSRSTDIDEYGVDHDNKRNNDYNNDSQNADDNA